MGTKQDLSNADDFLLNMQMTNKKVFIVHSIRTTGDKSVLAFGIPTGEPTDWEETALGIRYNELGRIQSRNDGEAWVDLVGYSGWSGYSGFSGFSGLSGESGTSGWSGEVGPRGESGFSGYSGWSGARGQSGFSGQNGMDMYYSLMGKTIWKGKDSIDHPSSNKIYYSNYAFNLNDMNLMVFVNGLFKLLTIHYTIIDENTIEFVSTLEDNDDVAIVVINGTSGYSGTGTNNSKTVYVADTNNYRVVGFNTLNFTDSFIGFGVSGTSGGQFYNPLAVAKDSAGLIYVADTINHRIVRFNPTDFAGTFTSWGTNGSGSEQFNHPMGVAVDGSGLVYVADYNNNRIVRFNPTDFAGTFTTFGSAGSGAGHFTSPSGIAGSGPLVYVSDTDNHRVVSFNPSDFAGTFTAYGDDNSGYFWKQTGIAIHNGLVYVVDTQNHRVVRFNPSDFAGTETCYGAVTSTTSLGTSGSGTGQFDSPVGISIDSAGIVYVGDTGNNRIVMFNPSDFVVTFTTLGSIGSGNDQFMAPGGVLVI